MTDSDIGSIHCRAQNVRPGGLFVAVPGFSADGHDYIDQALIRGAGALVVERPVSVSDAVVLEVENARLALALISAEFYGRPCGQLVVIAITGTNGKTTTAYLIEAMLAAQRLRVGVIGTINYRFDGRIFDNPVTTPESIDLQRILAEMAAAGVTHVVMEVSSHALALHRIAGCHPDIGVFTNLSQDHLDFHGTMAAYWDCKKRLFTEHLGPENPKPDTAAVINTDDARGRELADAVAGKTITTGFHAEAAIHPIAYRLDRRGIEARLAIPGGAIDIRSPLVGAHNLENLMSAVGVGLAVGIRPVAVADGIGSLKTVPGRLEPTVGPGSRFVYVDYAHTPDALEHALRALRNVVAGRLLCVFGCGGDRDRGKRPLMGAIASRCSDLTVVTSDNPRTEPPMRIIEDILAGVRTGPAVELTADAFRHDPAEPGFTVEADRRKAIRLAVAAMRDGDTLLIAGKGHETYQILGDRTVPFDDGKEARSALEALDHTHAPHDGTDPHV